MRTLALLGLPVRQTHLKSMPMPREPAWATGSARAEPARWRARPRRAVWSGCLPAARRPGHSQPATVSGWQRRQVESEDSNGAPDCDGRRLGRRRWISQAKIGTCAMVERFASLKLQRAHPVRALRRMSEWGVYSIVNPDSAKLIVTPPNHGPSYDRPILAEARGAGRSAGRLSPEAQAQA